MGEISSGLSSALEQLAAAGQEADRAAARRKQPRTARAPALSAPRPKPHDPAPPPSRIIAIPALVVLATALLVPAVWSLLVLTGVWQSERSDARTMALAMLACWPIAFFAYAGAALFYVQLKAGPPSHRRR